MVKYNSYKDSGIEWIGKIPENWMCLPMKYILKEPLKYGANESATDNSPENPRYIRITDFGNDGKLRNETFKSLPVEKANGYLLEEGDLLFARSGATVGKTFLFNNYGGKACFAGYLIKASFEKERIESRYIYYVARSNYYENWKESIFNQATIQNIGADKYSYLNIPIPSCVDEQRIIANYLDHKIAEIDELVSKKERLVALMQEEQTAVINQAVTKGLDPNVPMKDSGMEWLGKIPEHWEVWKISHLYPQIGSGTTPKSNNLEFYSAGTINWLNTGDLNNGIIKSTSKKITEAALKTYSTLKIYPQGSVVMAMYGATIGKLGVLEIVSTVNQACCVFPDSEIVYNEFLFYWLLVKKEEIINLSKGGGQPNISQDIIKRIKIGIPHRDEQFEIIGEVKREIARIADIKNKITKEINLLKEYKTALISEVVTGKVDVRNEVLVN